MKIRNLKPEDIDEVKKLCNMVHWPLTLRDIKRLYELEPDGWFCAEVDNQCVGQAMGIAIGSLGCIGMVIVHENYRRRGIGTALTTEALSYLRNKGVQTIELYGRALPGETEVLGVLCHTTSLNSNLPLPCG